MPHKTLTVKRVAVICGGKSPEHEISVRSAKNILAAMPREEYEVLLIGVDFKGAWRLIDEGRLGRFVEEQGDLLALVPAGPDGPLLNLATGRALPAIDAVFLILHGPNGEDGITQGALRLLGLPFVGPDVLGSAVAMDKDVAKRLLSAAGLNVARGRVLHAHEQRPAYAEVMAELGSPLFVKPANMGSSVGVHKVNNEEQFATALEDAFQYDKKVIVEEMITGRELECAVMGNTFPEVTDIGEIITPDAYTFDAKYEDEHTAQLLVPTQVTEEERSRLQETARRAYQALETEVMARVDMFLTPAGEIYVNEINTLPGFTNISMYPQLWGDAGIGYTALIRKLLDLAIARYDQRKKLKTTWRA